MKKMKKFKIVHLVFIVLAISYSFCYGGEKYKLLFSWGNKKGKREVFSEPVGIAIDKNKTVYIADRGDKKVKKFTAGGEFITEWKTLYIPRAIAVDESGNVYVAEMSSITQGLIEKFNSEGKLIKKWTYPGEFVGGVAVSKNFLYLGNNSRRSIDKFTLEGELVKSFGKFAVCCGYLDVAVDSEENIYVAELGAHRVVKYDRNGNLIKTWGKPGTTDGTFCGCCNPINIAVGPDGVFTSEKSLPRIQKFTKEGEFVTSFGQGAFSSGCSWLDIAVSHDGIVFAVDEDGKRVFVFVNSKIK